MTLPTLETIQHLHSRYCALTGYTIRLDMAREHEWFTWCQRGFNSDDLACLVAHLKREIKAGKRNAGSLKWRNLIVNVDWFEEDLAEARAMARQQLSPRDMALKAPGRPVEASRPARSVADILAGEEAFKALMAMKERL